MAGGGRDCVFCRIIKGAIKSKKLYQDKWTTAFLDINPRNPGHTLVVTNNHYETIMDLPEGEAGHLFEAVRRVSIAIVKGTPADGVSISQSSGACAGQLINHIHFHVIPRFASEDPVSLEGILPVKNIPEKQKDEIVKKIVAKIPQQ
jgi:histidine triad (HIT) family protein